MGATGRAARLLGTAVLALAVLPGGPAPLPSAPRSSAPGSSAELPAAERAPGTVAVAQMNLCNSGMAACFSAGVAVDAAAARIRRLRPDLVAAQEVCRDDVAAGSGRLAGAMAAVHGADRVAVAFAPAVDLDTGGPYRCTNGEPFGNAVLARGGAVDVRSATYAAQDGRDEARVWVCAAVLDGRLTACTTHLSTVRAVARQQCAELGALLRSPWVRPPAVVAGDLNGAGRCAPPGWSERSDGRVQHVFAGPGLVPAGGGTEPLPGTDHPLLLAVLRPAAG